MKVCLCIAKFVLTQFTQTASDVMVIWYFVLSIYNINWVKLANLLNSDLEKHLKDIKYEKDSKNLT